MLISGTSFDLFLSLMHCVYQNSLCGIPDLSRFSALQGPLPLSPSAQLLCQKGTECYLSVCMQQILRLVLSYRFSTILCLKVHLMAKTIDEEQLTLAEYLVQYQVSTYGIFPIRTRIAGYVVNIVI